MSEHIMMLSTILCMVCALRETDDVTSNCDNIGENVKGAGILFNPPGFCSLIAVGNGINTCHLGGFSFGTLHLK